MARKKVEICGVNTSSLPLLSEEEKEDLFERIEQGAIGRHIMLKSWSKIQNKIRIEEITP